MTRDTLAIQVGDAIRADILAGRLVPNRRLRMAELEERYGVSATPLRESLQRLASEGLVALDPRYGASVALISLDELDDLYDVRMLVEREALARSVRRGGDEYKKKLSVAMAGLREVARQEQISGISALDDPATRDLWVDAHQRFHLTLLGNSGSPWLDRFIETLYDHAERYRLLARATLHASRDWVGDHEALYGAANAGDVQSAVGALERYWAARYAIVRPVVETHLRARPEQSQRI